MPFPNQIPRSVAWPSSAVINWMRERVAAGGGDPTDIPDEPVRFWRLPEVIERTSMGRTTIWRRVRDGQFPKPVTLRDMGEQS